MAQFKDNFKDISGTYLTADDKQELIDNGIPFEIVSVQKDEENQYGPRYVLTVLVPDTETGDTEEKLLAFPTESGVESRNRMCRAMLEFFEDDDAEPQVAKLVKKGRSLLLELL